MIVTHFEGHISFGLGAFFVAGLRDLFVGADFLEVFEVGVEFEASWELFGAFARVGLEVAGPVEDSSPAAEVEKI